MEKSEHLHSLFFTGKTCLQPLESSDKSHCKEDLPSVEEDHVREHLNRLSTPESIGPNGMHSRDLRKLVTVIARLYSIIFKRSEELQTGQHQLRLVQLVTA